jgi:hypothetical protein
MCNSSAWGENDFPGDVLTEKAIKAGLLPAEDGEFVEEEA